MKRYGLLFCLMFSLSLSAADQPAQTPLFTVPAAPPVMMINMSNDHQLYFKAYDDFSDLTGDGSPDTTYIHSFDYYGYFDSYKCYSYQNNRFEPQSVASDKYCSGQWSGNFLNWATMTRMDIVRKILYGGLRSTDTANNTVLERAHLPHDAHSFAKYYNGSDLHQLTPFNVTRGQNIQDSGITLCNTTDGSNSGNNRWSQTNTNPPLVKVARGNYALWATNERWQCRWGTNSNDNIPAQTGLLAHPSSPGTNRRLGGGDLNVRVQVCAGNEELRVGDACRNYASAGQISYKPAGLLQEYGENGSLLFGLMTGSYARNKSGGVLRRNVGSIANEIDSLGRFQTINDAIIHTLDRLRISRYDYNEGTYTAGGHDNCGYNIPSFSDGRCSNWGNPQAEIYLESLRYLAGKNTPTAAFNANDSSHVPARDGNLALTQVVWSSPADRGPVCSPLNILQFNASTISYDGDQLGNDLGIDVDQWTNKVGADEGIHGKLYFIGKTSASDPALRVCTAKTISALANVDGLCPEAPRLEGTYKLAGLARFAREQGLPGGSDGAKRKVRTFGVALAPGVPKIEIPVPGSSRKVTILPACLNTRRNDMVQNCAIVDFKVVTLNLQSVPRTGRVYINWEISEQGGDFDSDMWGVLDFSMTATELQVTTNVIADSVGAPMGFGYTVSGTTADGFYTPSGINNHPGNNHPGFGCTNCNRNNAAVTRNFTLGDSSGTLLEPPLFYASKWGGYRNLNNSGQPVGYEDSYFAVTNPSVLQASLAQVFEQAATGRGTAVGLTSDGVGVYSDRRVFQARFFSENWTGDLLAYDLSRASGLATTPLWQASQHIPQPAQRRIFTRVSGAGVSFDSSNLTPAMLQVASNNDRDKLVNYLRGVTDQEERFGGNLRNRIHASYPGQANLLGDIVNSRPVYISPLANFGHAQGATLTAAERNSYTAYRDQQAGKPSVVYVGSNNGMLHAFNAATGKELFAYIPSMLLPELKSLAEPGYLSSHRFFVDGRIRVGDVYTPQGWRRILVGSLGAGGKGLFALDVTNPQDFTQSHVLWEISDTELPQLGYNLGEMHIARLATGDWSVLLGNGYASDDGKAQLLLLNALTGQLIHSLELPGVQNGLSAPFVADLQHRGVADTAYAGDLIGNVWKFNLTSADADDWGFSNLYAPEAGQERLRPITVRPEVSRHPDGGYAVHLGTGRYFSEADQQLTVATQRFMTLRDADGLGSGLVQQTLVNHASGDRVLRLLSNLPVAAEARGCYFELPDQGERMVQSAVVDQGMAYVTSMTPEPDACNVGASSYVMNFNPYTCGRAAYGSYSNELLPDPFNPSGPPIAVSGVDSTVGMSTSSLVQGEFVFHAGLLQGQEGNNIDSSGRNLQRSRINEPGYRIWHRCTEDNEC